MPAPYLMRPVQRYGSVPRGPLSAIGAFRGGSAVGSQQVSDDYKNRILNDWLNSRNAGKVGGPAQTMVDYTPGIKAGLYDKYLPDAINVYGPEDRGSPGPLVRTLPLGLRQDYARIGSAGSIGGRRMPSVHTPGSNIRPQSAYRGVPAAPVYAGSSIGAAAPDVPMSWEPGQVPPATIQDYGRIGLPAPRFAPEYSKAETFHTGGIGDVQGGWTNVVGPQFQYTPQEQTAMSRQRAFGQSSFGDVGLMPESYRRFAAGGQFGAPAQQAPPASMQNIPTGTRIGNAEVFEVNGRKVVVGDGHRAGERPLVRPRVEVSTGPPPGGLSPEMEERRQATIAQQRQNQQMLGAGRNVRANRLYGTPLRPDLFPQVQQMLPGGQTAATITDTDRRIINRFASEDGEIDWSGAINEYRQRGVDPAAAAGKLEQGGLTIADIDEAIAQSSGTFGFGRDDEQIAYLMGLKQALQGRARKGPFGAPASPAAPRPSPVSPPQPAPPQGQVSAGEFWGGVGRNVLDWWRRNWD